MFYITSFVIVSQAFETTKRNNLDCLGDLTPPQMRARQTHLLPLIIQKSISYLRIWVRPASGLSTVTFFVFLVYFF